MQNNHKSFIVDHSQDVIDLLTQNDFTEQPSVITNLSEDSPLKILVQRDKQSYFSVCTDNLKTTLRFARAILEETPEQIDLDRLRKEVTNG